MGPPAAATQKALEGLIAETIQLQKELNWCVDKLTYEKYGTKDPSKPGVYWMSAQEVEKFTSALGDGPTRWIKSKMPPPAQQLVDNSRRKAGSRARTRQDRPGSRRSTARSTLPRSSLGKC